ncbi:hypothetical protein SAMN06298212_10410 [Ruaniaceae bacterium KH17]|nr:hypothetical protein SAMN06298212_10410 [Ruaniaceae bacterium KH17]
MVRSLRSKRTNVRYGKQSLVNVVVWNVMTTTLEPQLTAQDRCDACGAQAYVRVQLESGSLLFCAHHARRHADRLAEVAIDVHDETSRLREPEPTA